MELSQIDRVALLSLQGFSSLLSFIGSLIVLFNFFSDNLKNKKLFHKTMIHLIITSLFLSLAFMNHIIFQGFIINYYLKYIDNPLVIEIFNRIFYSLKTIGQFFILSSACWTVCTALSLLYSIKYDQEVNETRALFFFYFISIFIPFTSSVVWEVIFQVKLGKGSIDKRTLAIYYIYHAFFLLICFIINLILLFFIWASIKKAIKVFYFQKETISEFKIIFNLSLYIIPFLLCGSWQFFGYITIGFDQLNETGGLLRILSNLIEYPYAILFPLQGFLNCVVFYFNKKQFKTFLQKICCFCSKSQDIN